MRRTDAAAPGRGRAGQGRAGVAGDGAGARPGSGGRWCGSGPAGSATPTCNREGGINDDFPFLLGHEAAGVVESVGTGVADVAPGDFVVLNWRAVCGGCRACLRGEPWYCFATQNASQKMTLAGGIELSPALDIGAFVEKTLVAAGQHEGRSVGAGGRGRAAGLRGDGRAGCAITTGGVTRGRSVAVIGCGGVGADVVIDAVGRPETWQQAFYVRDLAGTVVLVGVPTPDMRIPDIPLIDVFGRGRALKSSWYGDCLPSRDFPMLVDLYQQGRLDLDAFVSEEIDIGDIEAAFQEMRHPPEGETVHTGHGDDTTIGAERAGILAEG